MEITPMICQKCKYWVYIYRIDIHFNKGNSVTECCLNRKYHSDNKDFRCGDYAVILTTPDHKCKYWAP